MITQSDMDMQEKNVSVPSLSINVHSATLVHNKLVNTANFLGFYE